MDDAVRATLEMESYIKPVPSGVSSVTDEQEEKETNTVVTAPVSTKMFACTPFTRPFKTQSLTGHTV